MMHQSVVYEPTPLVVDVDGFLDPKTAIKYIGKATRQPDGTYRALAQVPMGLTIGLAIVECKISFEAKDT